MDNHLFDDLVSSIKEAGVIKRKEIHASRIALSKIFGDDGYFGLAQTLMHIIESAPDWPIQEIFKDSDNEWIRLLKHRARLIIKRLK